MRFTNTMKLKECLMRKQLGFLTSLLFLCAMSLVGVGCSSWNCCPEPVCEQPCPSPCPQPCYEPCKPACPAPCAPVCQPPCEQPKAECCAYQEPCCKILPRCEHPSSNKLCCADGINVFAKNPSMCLLGEQYPLEFVVEACDDVCDVVVHTNLPDGVTYISSQPEAKAEGKRLTWNFGPMSKGEVINAKVVVKCECEGEQCACFCASATPVRFCALLCAKPILTCEKCGPEEVCPGDPVNYKITVSNRGSCTAEEVVVTDNIPEGLEHCSGLRTLVYKLGCLKPCETKTVNIALTAVKRGKVCNTAVVTACNADSVSCQACTCVCCCAIEVTKVGPKEQQIGKNADYQITVSNTGDKVLHDLVVTDYAPSSTSIVAANGAAINGNQAVWKLKELKPGDKVSFTITLTTCVPGCFTNRVTAATCECCASTEFTTRWRGRPALNVCVTNTENPICIGERTSYIINVVNQGSESDSNVLVVVKFPNEISPVAVAGDINGKVSGQTVTFEPVANLRPRQTVSFRVDAEGKASGDGRVSVEVSSDAIKTPIVQQESTVVN